MANGDDKIRALDPVQPQDGTQDLIAAAILIALTGALVVAIIRAITRAMV